MRCTCNVAEVWRDETWDHDGRALPTLEEVEALVNKGTVSIVWK